MIIDAFLTPYFPETENQFENSLVVMIDVLRASTTVCAALNAGAKEVIPSDSLDKAVRIYNSLSREVRFLGGERNGLMPQGFDAGNSPFEYVPEKVKGRSVILSTTNGTKTFQKAKNAKHKVVAAFANNAVITEYIKILLSEYDSGDAKLVFLCAGTNGRMSYEDVLCAGIIIHEISQIYTDCTITDTADAARNLYAFNANDMKNFLMKSDHAKILAAKGFEKDIEFCLTMNTLPVIPIVGSNTIRALDI
ncbi:MAG: 2-phosphosulfolactate phosphatase [Ignavibacteriae bacterium HGW-Ignavibacteriae-1]|jgi:2-phosphosulfolactate phosphatase|nr:MAG: 2-phosphosulfolactate phosphatase [Ignavibacteriae bacterium HGW-Ignavibacteriae-1]